MIKIPPKLVRSSLIVAVWGVAVCAGFWSLWGYETAAGDVRAPATTLRGRVALESPQLPTLTIAVHPDCPCSRASIAELTQLMTYAHGGLNVDIVFAEPVGIAQDPATTDLWTSAKAIPGVHLLRDPGGIRCKALHATISGQVFLYDAAGHLQFTGGITGSRGHEGENEGLDSIEAFLDTGHAMHATTPVYGCLLY
jgi:hypothetical protein